MYCIADAYLHVECIDRLMANLLTEHIKRNNTVLRYIIQGIMQVKCPTWHPEINQPLVL